MPDKKLSESQEINPFNFAPPVDLKSTIKLNQTFVKALQSYNEELIKFGTSRLKEDMAVPQQLANCKTTQDFIKVYTDFFQTAIKQYTEEAATLSNISHLFGQVEAEENTAIEEKPKSQRSKTIPQ